MSQICKADEESFAQAKQIMARGGLVVMPTDTVYGIVCDPCNPGAIARIYEAKGRPQYKALQVIMASVDDLDALGLELPAPLNRLAAQFLPGAFSPIAVASEGSPLATVRVAANGVRTQGIRVPNSATALAMLRVTGPVAASSANRSGEQSAHCVQEAVDALGDAIDLYIDGGATAGHVASTVVAADPHGRDGIEILREGVIPAAVIRRAIHLNGGGLGA
ncbi:L-threonylcarbamoyladenylate synthase [Bifidobacterium pseudolongum]|uniref:L-threonylcarbamoyladenylate synthase n=1 Tax=Bifidobacterium pseudolongum TaxID=1694 RepID=A0A395XG62_9BIFI|nr:L-threonylcarbamoyladenylate synthase [Bifidobacterium pseudolongum]RGW11233.1 threonylcarbamoyl-AMP synthase [Bifidobacterium pseudolongum]